MSDGDFEAGLIFTAARCNRLDIIRTLVSRGVDVNITDRAGRTAAHEAARNGHISALQLLHELGADLNATSNRGVSVAHQAAFGGHTSFLRNLGAFNVNMMLKDDAGRTPIDVARESKHREAVEVIAELIDASKQRHSIDMPDNFSWDTFPSGIEGSASTNHPQDAIIGLPWNTEGMNLGLHEQTRGAPSYTQKIGIYSPEARRQRIAKFHEKRSRRVWRKRIKYDCRKKLAESRPRIKGRFVSGGNGKEGGAPDIGVVPVMTSVNVSKEDEEEDDEEEDDEEQMQEQDKQQV